MADENSSSGSAKSSKLIPLLLLTNTLLSGAVLAFIILHPSGGAHSDSKHEATSSNNGSPRTAGPTIKMSDFVIHLRNTEAERFARLSVELELGNEEDKNYLTPYTPRIRDAFVSYLSDRTAEELGGSEGLNKAKVELLRQVEELVPGKHVRAIYFTDFVVQ